MIVRSILTAVMCIALVSAAQAVELEQVWMLEGFSQPESVAYDVETGFLYVSNVNGGPSDHNGAGFISRVNLDGTMDELHWTDGLDAPKGLVVSGNHIIVSDIDRIVFIDHLSGEMSLTVDVPGAVFLNDVAIAPQDQ